MSFSGGTFCSGAFGRFTHARDRRFEGAQVPTNALMYLEFCVLSSPKRGISPHELAKLRTVYGFVRSHVDAMQKKRPAVDPEVNPLIDPRSVSSRGLSMGVQNLSTIAPPQASQQSRT